ncbi:MAG: YceI family protein [Wenzhouxiangellaceae bacterium]|nr:YceI family protein [Wenzhouxiangellaceae bacterium]
MFRGLALTITLAAALAAPRAEAVERYQIDIRGQHAFIQFRIPHLGFSWLYGRFNRFDGEFTFDPADPSNSSVSVRIDTGSIDTNHGQRDDHLRGEDFLTTSQFPQAHFESTAFVPLGDDRYRLEGELSLLGRSAPIAIEVEQIGAGQDPWGGFRRGFEGSTTLRLKDWGIDYELPAAEEVELTLAIEGIRQD